MKQVWKLSLDPNGVIETFQLSMTKYSVTDIISLKRTFFVEENLEIKDENGKKYSVSFSNSNADFILHGIDSNLTRVVGKRVYKKLKVNTSKPLGKTLTITAKYIADAISPEDFDQPLHKSAEVIHKTIETFESFSAISSTSYLEVLYSMSLPDGGEFSEEVNKFNNPVLQIADVSISQEGITFPKNEFFIGTPEVKLAFNGKRLSHSNGKYVFSTVNPDSAVHAGIPIYNKFNQSVFSFEDWFTVDTKQKILNTMNLDVKEKVTTKELNINGVSIRTNSKGDLIIGDAILIDKNTKKVLLLAKDSPRLLSELEKE